MAKNMRRALEQTYSEVMKIVEESKTPREQMNFKRKQLQFLKGDVHRPKIPFRRCMLSLQRKKERRVVNSQRKRELGLTRTSKFKR